MIMQQVKPTLLNKSTCLNLLSSKLDRMNTVADRVISLRKCLGAKVTQTEFGRLAGGVSKSSVMQWEKGVTKPSWDSLHALRRNKKVNPQWVLSGKEPMFLPSSEEDIAPPIATAPPGAIVVAWENLNDLPKDAYVHVPHYDVELSAGDGTQWVEHADNSPLVFRAKWFAGRGLKPENCRALYVSGDSMQPELKDGDTVLIDTSSTTIRDDAVYALVYFDKLYIKRLFLLPGGGVELRSDNKHHPSREVHGADLAQLRILGEKAWRAG